MNTMKKRLYGYLMVAFIAMLVISTGKEVKAAQEVRAVWVSFFEYETAGLKDKTEDEFRRNADILFRNIRDNGCNTVYFHVRAFDDAIWPSDNFEFSSYMGQTEPGYDALEILIGAAHKYGLEFHAWMNPYRITQEKIYDPAKESTRSRIMLAVQEVINKYQVDGIHFDDYFYPSASHKQYKKYKKISPAKKKENVNIMVKAVYNMVKQKSSDLQFGISPAGNVDNCEAMGADIKTWMSQSGYIDYIVPQIYWSNSYLLEGKRTKLFDERLREWTSLNTAGINMYIGLGLYRGGMKDSYDLGWRKMSKVVASEISKTRRHAKVSGYALFSYESLYKESCKKEVKNMLERIGKIRISGGKKKLKKGKKLRLSATVWPIRLGQKVTWSSSNKKVAKVSKKGVVKARKKGTVKIMAKKGSVKAVLRIKVS